ncbi:hypothetical protein [Clostridium tagluense]|uniref:hypothetical protein n=1 Tax=Clostridium tagluense TaxID=360422 RepID=UPI001CF1F9E7|nr:hypothetical protein [Clostridium tagluense]MCB2297766.1 hypothetical protein [Clostridium tagluense]
MKMNKEITQAITELKQAEQNFQYAAPEFINVAIMQLSAVEMKIEVLLNLWKQKGPTPMDPYVREKSLTKTLELIVPQKEQTVNGKIQVQFVNYTKKSEKHLMAIGKNF